MAKLSLNGEASCRARLHGGAVELIGVLSLFLGRVHRQIRVSHHRLVILARKRMQANADARGDATFLLMDFYGAHRRGEQQLGDECCLRLARDLGQKHHEFITAESRDDITATQTVAKPRCHLAQQDVASIVAQRVVNGLEAVQIDE